MHFDVALNLIWSLVGGTALVTLGVSEFRRGVTSLRSRCRRGMAVFIATVALFPCISASDDLVCLSVLPADSSAATQLFNLPSQEKSYAPALGLALQLESLENFQISASRFSLTTFSQTDQVAHRAVQCCDRPLPSRADRAPPAPALAT
ncbi:MAG TPA: hypothetical protein VKV95_16940 [Terriglobia bacterium]|nr:hypothetical protein [Terriglobia bacterium]